MALAVTAVRLPWSTGAAWLLAAVLLATGLGKALDLPGFAQILETYRLFPTGSEGLVAASVTAAELFLAAGLIVPSWRRRAAGLAALFFLANAALLSVTLLRGIDLPNCGCFGTFLARPLRAWTPLEDLALMAAATLARGR